MNRKAQGFNVVKIDHVTGKVIGKIETRPYAAQRTTKAALKYDVEKIVRIERMFVSQFAMCIAAAVAMSAAALSSAAAAELPCGHPDSPPAASAKVRIEAWKEPRLVEEFKKFGRESEFKYFDGPLYVPVAGKPEQPEIFKYWQIEKAFESPKHFIAMDLSNAPGDGVYTLQIRRCATAQAWEPIWKSLMDVVDTKVIVEHVK